MAAHATAVEPLSQLPRVSARTGIEQIFVYDLARESPHIAMPRPEIDLVVRFGAGAGSGIDAHTFGARVRVHRKTPRGVRRTVTARLRLGATGAVLGATASQIAGRIVPLEELWGGADVRRLLDRLAKADATSDAIAIVESAIADRIARAGRLALRDLDARVSPLALGAARKLQDERINVVAGDLGVTERHLRRVFRETVGLGPKAFAKLARFRRAVDLALEANGAEAWAEIAIATGYYDQAHLIAEFRDIAGTTPRALLRELRTSRSIP